MMMKRWACLLAALVLLWGAAALAEGGLVVNGGFEASADGRGPDGWFPDMWLTSGESELSVEAGGRGGLCARVENLEPNDARFSQVLGVEPNTCYRITGYIRAEGIDEGSSGASLSVKDTFMSTEPLYDTGGAWSRVELVGITGADQRSLTLMCRVGDYGALTRGAAWFDDVGMERLENAVLDGMVVSFQTVAPGEGGGAVSGGEAGGADRSGRGMLALNLLMLAFVALCAEAAWSVERGRIELTGDGAAPKALWAALAVGLAVRLAVSVTVRGYGVDITDFGAWSARMAQLGPARFYAHGYFCDYPPGYLYVLWLVGGIRNLLQIPFDSRIDWLVLKLPPMLMDVGLAHLLHRALRPRVGRTCALLIAGLYALNPATILNSAAWGQIDVALALMLALSILWAIEDRWILSLPMFALSILVKPQALMFAPLGLVALAVRIARDGAPMDRLLRMLGCVAAALAAMVAACLPFVASLDPALIREAGLAHLPGPLQGLGWVVSLYGRTLTSYGYLTLNACNLYVLLDMNWLDMAAIPALKLFGYAAMGLGYLYAAALYVKARDARKLPLLAAMALSIAFCFGPMMHERYLFPCLALLLLAYAVDRDARLMIAFLAVSFTQFVNAALVLRSEHLLASEQIVNAGVSLANLAACALLVWTAFDLCWRGRTVAVTRVYRPVDARALAAREARMDRFAEALFRPRDYKLGLRGRDWALMLGLTLAYAACAFANLGDVRAPRSAWTSSRRGEQVVIDLGAAHEFHLAYYGSSFNDVNFEVAFSDDGEVWTKPYYAAFNQGLIFRWLWYEPMVEDPDADGGFSPLVAAPGGSIGAKHPLHAGRFARLTMAGPGLILGEIAFVGEDGRALPIASMYASGGRGGHSQSTSALVDEQDIVPARPSHLNGTYFDEIYHARTAYEHLNGLHAYEYTHPPLGKLLIALGIRLFGMAPFGWRFMGTLFGALMVPLMYLLAKQLMRRADIAFLCALLMATDLMHFTQTRIATIDSFAVFFIMLAYFFMLRYYQMSFHHAKLWRTLVPLGLSGVAMGCAIAIKWIGMYAAVGLAFLFFFTIWVRAREYRYVRRHMDEIDAGRRPKAQRIHKAFWRNLAATGLWCAVFFVAVPALIYYFSYYWQLIPDGDFSVGAVWRVQRSMLSYHAGLGGDAHLFRSPWYQWPVVAWPMWYYTGNEFLPEGFVSSISCMGNPAVFWVGLAAMLFVLGRLFTPARHDRRSIFVAVGFLSQYLPWVLVPRSTFIYHYFASVPFIILATGLALDCVRRRRPAAFRPLLVGLCAASLALLLFFYPIASGTPIPLWYARLLRWFNWINY